MWGDELKQIILSDHETPAVICGFFYSSAKKLRQWFYYIYTAGLWPQVHH